jgi:hypothetical protein
MNNNVVVTLYTLIVSISSIFTSGSGSGSGKIDLLVNGKNDPSAIVVLEDLKPGDNREVEKDLLAKCTSTAKVYLHLKDVSSSQGVQTEPEIKEENGSPKSDLENHIYYDLKFNNQTLISLSDQVLFSDAVSCWIPIGTLTNNTHYKMLQSFHFDPTVTNWAQGDKTNFTEEFIAIEGNQSPPVSPSGKVWDPTLKKCVVGSITPSPIPSATPTPTLPPAPLSCQSIIFSGPPIYGTSGDDNITGTSGNDLIYALGGNDHVEGNSGNDCIIGGPGQDRLTGNDGNDYIEGNDGHDLMYGNNGSDTLIGGPGVDFTNGGNNTDTCVAESKTSCEL